MIFLWQRVVYTIKEYVTITFSLSYIFIITYLASETCDYLLSDKDIFCMIVYVGAISLALMMEESYPKFNNHLSNILHTVVFVEFLSKYTSSFHSWFPIDVLTVSWFIYQFFCLGLNWRRSILSPPVRIIEQGSFCVLAAYETAMCHFICVRYLPFIPVLLWFWIASILDM